MKALTSIAPVPTRVAEQLRFLDSWGVAGLEPVSLNHPSEIEWLAHVYPEVEFVPTERTALARFGRHYVLLNAFLDLVLGMDAPALIVNADLEIRATPEQMARLEGFSAMALPYLLQYNCTSPGVQVQAAMVEPCGISAFVVHPRYVRLYQPSFMCAGQPWWDYWVPIMAAREGDTFVTPRVPIGYHYAHASGWCQENWLACAVELSRLLGEEIEPTLAAASALSTKVYAEIRKSTTEVDL